MPYQALVLPIISGLVAQLLKFFIKSNKQKPNLKNITAYSGMPSGHSAMVVSLATTIGLVEGLASPLFAISIILAVIVIRDALGIRRYLGEHGRVLNIMVRDLKQDHLLDEHYPHLLENVGHTPAQAIVGSLIGFVISVIGFWILK